MTNVPNAILGIIMIAKNSLAILAQAIVINAQVLPFAQAVLPDTINILQ